MYIIPLFFVIAFFAVLGALAELYSRAKGKAAGLVDSHPLLRNLAGEYQAHRGAIRFALHMGLAVLFWRIDPLAGAVLFGAIAVGSWSEVLTIWSRIRARLGRSY